MLKKRGLSEKDSLPSEIHKKIGRIFISDSLSILHWFGA